MRKILAVCCLIGILLLSACAPSGQQTGNTTTTDTTTEPTLESTEVSTDDSDWSDTDWSDDFTEPTDDDSSYDDSYDNNYEAEYVEIIAPKDSPYLLNPQKGGADDEAAALRDKIINSEDADLEIAGTIYYVSPNGDDYNDGLSPETAWKTCDAIIVNSYLIQAGDAILFERGGVYRRSSPITVKDGVTYAAYGEGDKPAIYGSVTNYAWGAQWEASRKKYVWKTTMYTREAGNITFNHGEAAGMPKYFGLNELTKNGDFYHNTETGTLYLYLDKGYPNAVYEDIEIGTRENIFTIPDDTENVVFDNLALKYAGMFAFDVQEYTCNTVFTNLEIGWIGGCRFNNGYVGLGNGIQWWQSTYDALVENCWVYQVYDAGITPQGVNGASTYQNLVFRGNLIEYCNYSIEVFDRNEASIWDGLYIEDNILRFAGCGWLLAHERPDRSAVVAHYVGWTYKYEKLGENGITFKNNIFDCSAMNLVSWTGKVYTEGLTISGNSFYQKDNGTGKAINFATYGQKMATNQAELEAAVKVFDPNPKVVKWLS